MNKCTKCNSELDKNGNCYNEECLGYPQYEFEGCEHCMNSAEENGVEYTQDATWENGVWICNHCNRPC